MSRFSKAVADTSTGDRQDAAAPLELGAYGVSYIQLVHELAVAVGLSEEGGPHWVGGHSGGMSAVRKEDRQKSLHTQGALGQPRALPSLERWQL